MSGGVRLINYCATISRIITPSIKRVQYYGIIYSSHVRSLFLSLGKGRALKIQATAKRADARVQRRSQRQPLFLRHLAILLRE